MPPGESLRTIGERFGVSTSTLYSHRKRHLGDVIARANAIVAKRVEQVAAAAIEKGELRIIDVHRELVRTFDKASKLLDACDEYLSDPADPGKYTLGPRGTEIDVVCDVEVGTWPDGSPRMERKVASLQEWLGAFAQERRAPGVSVVEPIALKSNVADPRKLVLEAATVMARQLEVARSFVDAMPTPGASTELERSPEFIKIRDGLARILRQCDRCREAALEVLG